MVTTVVYCSHCGSEEIVRNGKAPNGKQKYRCKTCKRQSRENPTPHAYPEERREEILRAYEERSSLRGIERTFGVSRTSVIEWIKKAEKLPALSETVMIPDANDPEATTLELDELWSFVLRKANQAWVWIALCRKTRQVVAYAIGDRSEKTCLSYGKQSLKRIEQDIATPIFGQPIGQSFQRSSTQQQASKQVRQLM